MVASGRLGSAWLKREWEGTPPTHTTAELGGRTRPWASGSGAGGASVQGGEVRSLLDE